MSPKIPACALTRSSVPAALLESTFKRKFTRTWRKFLGVSRQRKWLASRLDSNNDHRRVPNLTVFFRRKGESLAVTNDPADYHPGDLVTWDLGGNVPHIGKSLTRNQRKVA